MGTSPLPAGYRQVLEGIKERIRTARVKAALASNRELILLYWDIGRTIVERQRAQGWGAHVVDRLARDLQTSFPKLRCFVVIELKNGPFKPEYAGKMSFYLSAVDDLMRHEEDRPSVGLVLCRPKNKLVAELERELRGRPTP